MRRQLKLLLMLMLATITITSFVACATDKYKIMYGIADWYYTNHITLQIQYDMASPDEKAWLRKNVNPYMNIMRQVVIGMNAIDERNDVKASKCIMEIVRIATSIEYDITRIVQAIKTRDYDTLFAEALALKDFIIKKLNERGRL